MLKTSLPRSVGTSRTWASAQTNPGTRHGRPAEAPGGNTWAPECETRGPSPSPPPPPPSPASQRGESNFPIGNNSTRRDNPPAPPPSVQIRPRSQQNFWSPCRPLHPTPATPSRTRNKRESPARTTQGFHGGSGSQAGPPFGSPENPRRGWEPGQRRQPGEGQAGRGRGKLWKKGGGSPWEGAELSPDPRRLRAPRAGRPGARAGGARREGPQGAASTPEGAPSAGAVRARRGRTMAGASRAGWGRHGPHGGCRLRRRGRGRAAPGRRPGCTKRRGRPPERGRRGRTTAASRGARRVPTVREGAWPGRTK